MERRIKDRLNDHILSEAQKCYQIEPGQITLLDGFESFIYEFQKKGEAYILRIAHSLRRSESLIQAEVDWINYLADGGATVARAVHSARGKLVEAISDQQDGYFLTTAFVKAKGQPPNSKCMTPEFFEKYGELIGKMHRLSEKYHPSEGQPRRCHWDDPEMLDVIKFVPESQTLVKQRYQDLLTYLSTLPKNEETYGLVHQDAHAGNFFVDDQGEITLFDFDDCAYSWYANDIAIVLFYMITNHPEPEKYAETFFSSFLKGYRRHKSIDSFWLNQIRQFLKLREIDLYAVIHRSFDVANISNQWVKNFMRNRQQNIENDIPYLSIDFTQF